ncbi:DedA family protein [Devosia sp.]|uniref:DedA family protein n=1 Tax=Devosia sp. TaxID=1871048 RepID=UPI0027362F23|nr:DedA family protein [Devosia sp.]MDP2782923.1 DedA family protein [Devosia sp.]
MDLWNELISPLVTSPCIYVLVFVFVLIDAFFPPIPSELAVVGLAALSASTGTPEMYLLVAATILGAVCGDNIAYQLGKWLGQERISQSRFPAVASASQWAREELNRRPVLIILTAREIPIGRTAVNMTAGATGFPWRRFAPISAIAGTAWASYTILIAVFVGTWLYQNPFLAVSVAILLSLVAGLCIERVIKLLSSCGR